MRSSEGIVQEAKCSLPHLLQIEHLTQKLHVRWTWRSRAARRSLHLVGKTDPASNLLTKILASKIIEGASAGEHDPNQLRDAVLKSFKLYDA